MFIMKCFHPTLRITKSCCRAVPDDKFEVQNNPTCTNIGFSTSALFRGDRIWRKGTTNFSCSHLAVDISRHWGRDWASYCTEQPQVSMGGSFPCYRAIKKGCCIGKKPESTSKSVAWTYISCNLQNTNYVFRRIAIRIIYRRERRAGTGTWPGESKLFVFSLQCSSPEFWTRKREAPLVIAAVAILSLAKRGFVAEDHLNLDIDLGRTSSES